MQVFRQVRERFSLQSVQPGLSWASLPAGALLSIFLLFAPETFAHRALPVVYGPVIPQPPTKELRFFKAEIRRHEQLLARLRRDESAELNLRKLKELRRAANILDECLHTAKRTLFEATQPLSLPSATFIRQEMREDLFALQDAGSQAVGIVIDLDARAIGATTEPRSSQHPGVDVTPASLTTPRRGPASLR